jgi:hypothetical protein
MICQQLELLFLHYGISCCAEITAVVPRKARKRGPKPDSRGMNKKHLHPRQPTQRYGLCRGRERSYSPCFAWLPSLNSVQDYGVHSLVFVEFHETMTDAIFREKRVYKWPLASKPELIDSGRHSPDDALSCSQIDRDPYIELPMTAKNSRTDA